MGGETTVGRPLKLVAVGAEVAGHGAVRLKDAAVKIDVTVGIDADAINRLKHAVGRNLGLAGVGIGAVENYQATLHREAGAIASGNGI